MHPIIPLLQLVHTLRRIEGRKKLQKMVHILKELGAPFGEPFEYSSYGMYSLQLKNEVTVLDSEDLVREQTQATFAGNTTYVIEATQGLDELVKEFDLSKPPSWAERARKLNAMSPLKLEGVSTILFLQRTDSRPEGIRKRLLSLKPHLRDLADDCMKEAAQLREAA